MCASASMASPATFTSPRQPLASSSTTLAPPDSPSASTTNLRACSGTCGSAAIRRGSRHVHRVSSSTSSAALRRPTFSP